MAEQPGPAATKRREELKLLVTKAFDDSGGTCGYRRVHAQLQRWGVPCGGELVRALMREMGLVPCQVRRRRSLTVQAAAGPIADLAGRDFTAGQPGEKMAGDMTYIFTWEGWLYLAAVIDCATRKIIGWAMDDKYRTPLITKAINMAARNVQLPDRLRDTPESSGRHRTLHRAALQAEASSLRTRISDPARGHGRVPGNDSSRVR